MNVFTSGEHVPLIFCRARRAASPFGISWLQSGLRALQGVFTSGERAFYFLVARPAPRCGLWAGEGELFCSPGFAFGEPKLNRE
jgi:hypothetical protein